MLKLVLAFYFSTQYCSAVSKKTGGQPTLIRNGHFTHTHLRIIAGQDTNNVAHSFAVLLLTFSSKYGGGRRCTGSSITANWVLTAGHCVRNLQGSRILIWYGNYTTPPPVESEMISEVLDIFIHPGFRSNFLIDNDICLLRVSGIHVQRFGRLSSVDYSTLMGLPVEYLGGGLTDKLGDDQFRPMQVGEGSIVACDKGFRYWNRYLICITPKCSQPLHQPYEGDSGGPLLYDGKIIGVLSFGHEDFAYGGYTPVSPYIDWIYEVTKSSKIDKNKY